MAYLTWAAIVDYTFSFDRRGCFVQRVIDSFGQLGAAVLAWVVIELGLEVEELVVILAFVIS